MIARNDPLLSLEDFLAAAPAGTALFGLDLGTKTIGIAISDLRRRVATPMVTLRRKVFKTDAAELLRLAASREIAGLVLGMPFNMDGSTGPRVQATKAFARNLSQLTDLPMLAWDERMSTAAVTRTLIEADTSRARRREVVDKVAAAYILQGALDRMSSPGFSS